MLLNDKVPFRMQWPQYADLQVNGMVVIYIFLSFFSLLVVIEKYSDTLFI